MRLGNSLVTILLFSIVASAQTTKSWTEWSQKEAEKILNDSAWGQTYTEHPQGRVDTTVITNTRPGMIGDRRGESGQQTAQQKPVHYRARILSAKPVREAFARIVVLQQKEPSPDFVNQLQGFVDRDFGDYLVVSFSVESDDPRRVQGGLAMLGKLTGEMLKEKVYLEREDGKRAVFLDYKPPIGDGMGGKFVFSRTLDGQPFLSSQSESMKFFLQLTEKQKITVKYKVEDMKYGEELEY